MDKITDQSSQTSEPVKEKPKKKKKDELSLIFLRFGWFILVFTILVIIFILLGDTCSTIGSILVLLGCAGGCMALGSSIGFLFGIPRSQKQSQAPSSNTGTNSNASDQLISNELVKSRAKSSTQIKFKFMLITKAIST